MDKWTENENRIYVDRVEKCLINALDYVGNDESKNIFRFPDLLNHPDKSFVALGKFIQ